MLISCKPLDKSYCHHREGQISRDLSVLNTAVPKQSAYPISLKAVSRPPRQVHITIMIEIFIIFGPVNLPPIGPWHLFQYFAKGVACVRKCVRRLL